jgi:hypothetical protein
MGFRWGERLSAGSPADIRRNDFNRAATKTTISERHDAESSVDAAEPAAAACRPRGARY